MDEPLSNLDAKLRASMRGELKRLQKRLEATTLYVTHDQAEATTMADRVAVLRDGVLQQVGTPDEVYDRPANRFVATFIGSPPLSVLPGRLDADGHAFAVDGGALGLPDDLWGKAAEGDVVEVGVRPEDLELVTAGSDGALPGEVYVVEPTGAETIVEVRVGETVVTVRAPRGWDAEIGSAVGVRVDPRTGCFFDSEGVTRIHRTDRA
jgi:multiple sugar transport system ATP-binding protein